MRTYKRLICQDEILTIICLRFRLGIDKSWEIFSNITQECDGSLRVIGQIDITDSIKRKLSTGTVEVPTTQKREKIAYSFLCILCAKFLHIFKIILRFYRNSLLYPLLPQTTLRSHVQRRAVHKRNQHYSSRWRRFSTKNYTNSQRRHQCFSKLHEQRFLSESFSKIGLAISKCNCCNLCFLSTFRAKRKHV